MPSKPRARTRPGRDRPRPLQSRNDHRRVGTQRDRWPGAARGVGGVPADAHGAGGVPAEERCAAVMRATGVVLLLVALAGCVGPARTPTAYEAKAGQAAAEALSQVRTALLAVDAGAGGRLPSAYEETVLVDAEAGIGSVRTSFDSIQPPADP